MYAFIRCAEYSVHLILMYHYSVISYAARNGKAVHTQE